MFPSTANFINDDVLFDEVSLILAFLTDGYIQSVYDIGCVAARWSKVFKDMSTISALPNFRKMVRLILLLAWQQRCRRARLFTHERRVELGKDANVCGNSTGIANHQSQLGFYLPSIHRRARERREPT